MKDTSWFEVVELSPGTHLIRERLDLIASFFGVKWVNIYLVVGQQRAALIDSGMGLSSLKPVIRELTDLPVVVISTHGHWDHVGGNWEFDEILAHRAEAEQMSADVPLSFVRRTLQGNPELAARLGLDPDDEPVVRGTRPTGWLAEGDTIELGARTLVVLETPGHSPGHLAFLDRGEGLLATGDAAYEGTMWAQVEDGDPAEFVSSLKRLSAIEGINELRLLPGHERSPLEGGLIRNLANFVERAYNGQAPWEPWEVDSSVRRHYEGKLAVLLRA